MGSQQPDLWRRPRGPEREPGPRARPGLSHDPGRVAIAAVDRADDEAVIAPEWQAAERRRRARAEARRRRWALSHLRQRAGNRFSSRGATCQCLNCSMAAPQKAENCWRAKGAAIGRCAMAVCRKLPTCDSISRGVGSPRRILRCRATSRCVNPCRNVWIGEYSALSCALTSQSRSGPGVSSSRK
jgi:hypothetical protein